MLPTLGGAVLGGILDKRQPLRGALAGAAVGLVAEVLFASVETDADGDTTVRIGDPPQFVADALRGMGFDPASGGV